MCVCVCRLNALLLLPASSKAFRTAKLARAHSPMATPLQLEIVRKKAVLLALNHPSLKATLDAIDDEPKEGETADETRQRFEAHRVTLDAMTAAFEVGKSTAPATGGDEYACASVSVD